MKRYILFLKKEKEDTFVNVFAAEGKISQMTETCRHHGTSAYCLRECCVSSIV